MYKAFLYFAFLAFCSAAPYGDLNSARLLVQQPTNVVRVQQQDQTDLVDTLGGGYSYFKKQPIVSRPLIQQQLAMSEQQVPLTSSDDTSNQWSDYTKASAFKQQPVQKRIMSASNDLLLSGSFGQQQSVPVGYGSQQDNTNVRVNLMPQTLVSQDQGAYGSGLDQVQQQPLVRNLGNSYGQQQQDLPTFVPQQQQPIIRNLGSSYGQQQQQQDLQKFVPQQQQPIIRNLDTSYGQQQQQDLQTFAPQQQQQQDLQTFVPQQQQPIIRNLGSSYGQQQQDLPTFLPQQQQPIIRNLGSSYGQQQQQQQDLQTFVPQQQPIIRNLGSSYGQQQQDLQTFVPQQQQPIIPNLGSSYGQQQQDLQTFVPQQQQPIIPNLGSSYGQQQQDLQTFLPQQQQPMIRNLGSSYGQQQQDLPKFLPQQQQPILRNLDTSYGQQQQDLPTFVPQQQQPIIRNLGSSYGQQQQDLQTFLPQQQQPIIRNLGNSYGQQQPLEPSTLPVKSNNAYGQQTQPVFNDLISGGGYNQQVQQKMAPTTRIVSADYGQQQPDVSSVQLGQPTFSQQTEFSRSNSAMMPSSRFVSQSQPAKQMADTSSFGGW